MLFLVLFASVLLWTVALLRGGLAETSKPICQVSPGRSDR